jgi:hypothetical protein
MVLLVDVEDDLQNKKRGGSTGSKTCDRIFEELTFHCKVTQRRQSIPPAARPPVI